MRTLLVTPRKNFSAGYSLQSLYYIVSTHLKAKIKGIIIVAALMYHIYVY